MQEKTINKSHLLLLFTFLNRGRMPIEDEHGDISRKEGDILPTSLSSWPN